MYTRDLAKIFTIPELSIIMYSPLLKTHVPVCCAKSNVPVPTCTIAYAGLDAIFKSRVLTAAREPLWKHPYAPP